MAKIGEHRLRLAEVEALYPFAIGSSLSGLWVDDGQTGSIL
jgi:hypothetical protein